MSYYYCNIKTKCLLIVFARKFQMKIVIHLHMDSLISLGVSAKLCLEYQSI